MYGCECECEGWMVDTAAIGEGSGGLEIVGKEY